MGAGLPPLGSRQLEVSLTLLLGADDGASVHHLTEQGRHTLVGHVGTGRHRLDDLGHGVQAVTLHAIDDGGLDRIVCHLLSSRLLLSRVLLRQQFQFMLDELDQGRVGLDLGQGQQGVVVVTLGELLSSSHSIILHFSL